MIAAQRVLVPVCVAVAVAATTACTESGGAASVPRSASPVAGDDSSVGATAAPCDGGTVSLGPLYRRVVVTDVSGTTRVDRAGKTSFTAVLRPVRSVTPAVEAPGAVDATLVFAEFAKQAGPGLAPIGEPSPHEKTSGQWTVDGTGTMVVYESVRLTEASFTYRCRGIAVSGVVRSWGRSGAGIMQCDSKNPPSAEVVREVTALSC
jgi:hypothetical protein